ncbi:MAG: T9SS type A sorting domain-containing protein [Flavobacteriales bacterium]|nr:T9SS type A sorting domain-containing protein [Flavobacteriales bacterium]
MLKHMKLSVIFSFAILLNAHNGFTQLSGVYTIDSATTTSGRNYQTFSAAISALSTSGVSAAVTFNVLRGTYSGQITIPAITGASPTNSVTFKGQGGQTVITASPTISNLPVVSLNGASHITLDSLKINITGSQGWGIHFRGHSDSNIIQNCHIVMPHSSSFMGIIASSTLSSTAITQNEAEYVSILNNRIEGGDYGVFIKGVTTTKSTYGTDITINYNTIIDYDSKGIDVSNNHNVDIIGNVVSSSKTANGGALTYWDAGDNARIIGNKFYASSNSANTRVVALSMAPGSGSAGDSAQPIIIANNFIQYEGTNSTGPTGLLLKNKAYLKVYSNTIKIKNQGSGANCIWLDANNTRNLDGIEIRNNIMYLENSGSGQFIFGAANGASFKNMVIDHNNYYAPSNYFRIQIPNGTSGISTYTSFTAYKANTSGYGNGAMNVDPLFLTSTNLHATSATMNDSGVVITGLTTDIDGDIRSTSTPDIGADEYTPGQIVCPGPMQVFNECPGFSVTVGSKTYNTTGIYTDTLVGSRGCDSIIITNLFIGQVSYGIDTVVACDSHVWTNGITYTTNNTTATDTLVNASGCDSIITLNLTILNSSSSVDTQTVCDTLVWIDGKTYTYSTNLPKKTFKNSVGCDSVVTLNLTVLKSNFGVDRKTACDSFTWIDGVTYTNSNNSATHTIKNAAGCDSLVYLDLKIKNSTTGTDTKVACGSYTWIDGITYTSNNNTAKDTLANKAGCDSIVTLNLTITNSTTGIDTQVACDSFTWIDGITYTTSNNTAKDTLINGVGCDSVVTLNLTINTVDTSTITNGIVITSNASNASHQWIDCKNENKPIAGENGVSFTPEANGDYAVIVTENACVDTSACVTISIVGLAENSSKQIIKLIPNPNNGSFKVDLGETHFQSLEVVNLQGQIVFQKEIENRKIVDINIGQSISSKGVYLLRLNGNGGSVTHRFVVE